VCGICGVVQVGGEPRRVLAPGVLDRMTDAMTHRGPDDRGTYEADGVALGVRRLSIVDVGGGHQPVSSEDGRVVAVQNGELYNHTDLRRELERAGHRFRSGCDTDVIPHLYEDSGPAFEERLRGKFAIAVWDERTRSAVVARDRLGIKPLYYARCGDLLVFGSELKSVLASGLVSSKLDYEAIDVYLTLSYFPGGRTPLAGVRKLEPGHRLEIGSGDVRVERYWDFPEPTSAPAARTEEETTEMLLELLDEAVRDRLMSDVPLGAMLSGGLDSSLVVALMARHMTEPVKTFAIGFSDPGGDNELADARFVAETLGTEHHELELSYESDVVDLPDLLWHLDEPVADLSALGFHALSRMASRHVTVALSGQGADELFGGYRKHRAAAAVGTWRRTLGPAAGPLGGLVGRLPDRFGRAPATLAAADPVERLLATSGQLDPELRAELARGPLAGVEPGSAERAVRSALGDVGDDPLPAMLYLDGRLALVDDMVHYFDRASMAHGLEVRVPFLDHRLVEFCATIPAGLKIRGRTQKYILKRAAQGLVPDRIVDKRKRGFFRRSSVGWLQAQMPGAVSDYLLGPSPRCAEFLDRDALERLLADYRAGRADRHVHLLIAVLLLEIWLTTYLPRAVAHPMQARERIVVGGA
jgi:asparagine synthase (glutamine-hydrolysing)